MSFRTAVIGKLLNKNTPGKVGKTINHKQLKKGSKNNMISLNKLKGKSYEEGAAVLANDGYGVKAGKENYSPCDVEYEYATDIYFFTESEDKSKETDRICCTIYSNDYIYTNEDEGVYNVLDSDTLKTTWEKDDPRITKVGVLANLKKLIGRNIDDLDTDVCEAFEDYDEQGETCMSCEESQDNCTYVASIDVEHSTSFVINCDSDNVIIDVWIQER